MLRWLIPVLSFSLTSTASPLDFYSDGAGPWSAGPTWIGGQVGHEYPLAGDAAWVTHAVTVGVLADVDDLTLTGGGSLALNTDAQLNLWGISNWSSGFVRSPGTLWNGGTLRVSDSWTKGLYYGATLENAGTVEFSTVLGVNHGNTRIENRANALIDFGEGAGLNGGNTLVNEGVMRKSSGADTTLITVTNVVHDGLLEVQSGSVFFGSVATFDAMDGAFDVASGSKVKLDGATYTGSLSGTGQGQIELYAGQSYFLGTGGVVFDFADELLQWTGGNVRTDTLTNVGYMTLSGPDAKGLYYSAVLDNHGTIRIRDSGPLNNHATITMLNAPGALMEMESGTSITSGQLVNEGLFLKSTSADTARLALGTIIQDGTVEVAAGGLTLDAATLSSAGGLFDIASGAVLRLSSATLSGRFNGAGDGSVELYDGQTYSLGTTGATFDCAPGLLHWTGGIVRTDTLLNLDHLQIDGDHTKYLQYAGVIDNAGKTIMDGAGGMINHTTTTLHNRSGGEFEIRSGLSILNGRLENQGRFLKTSSADTASLSLAEVANSGTIETTAGALDFQVASFTSDTGAFIVDAGSLIRLNPGTYDGVFQGFGAGMAEFYGPGSYFPGVTGMTLDGEPGLFHWTGGVFRSGTFSNVGTLTISPGLSKSIQYGAIIDNQGTISVDESAAIINHTNIQIINGPSGTFEFRGPGQLSNGWLQNDGILRRSGGGGASTLDMPLDNTGLIHGAADTLILSEVVNNLDGEVRLEGGRIEYSPGTFDLQGGSLTGFGTFAGDVFASGAATVAPGLSSGWLAIAGDYIQSPAARLEIELSGTDAGTGYDVLEAEGEVILEGTLVVTATDLFEPRSGDVFDVVRSSSYPDSSLDLQLPTLRENWYWDVNESANGIQLSVVGGGPVLQDLDPGRAGEANTIIVTGATPGRPVGIGYGFAPGSTPLPVCGLSADIANPTVLGIVRADGTGAADITQFVPPAASGLRVFVQALDLASCRLTNRLRHDFP